MSGLAVDIIGLVVIGVVAFAATNVDDIFLLMMFFSSSSIVASNVVAGQYAGIGLLMAISVLGSLITLVVPSSFIALLGFGPIAIGIKKLYGRFRHQQSGEIQTKILNRNGRAIFISVSKVAAVTFADGSDNIGVYVPLFASHGATTEIITLVAIVMVMSGLWCAMGHYVVNHSFLERNIRRFGDLVFPFVLIAIGISVLAGIF